MFCNKCGKEIPNDTISCQYCGEKIVQTTNQNSNNARSKVKKPIYKKAWFWIVIFFVIIVVGSGINSPKTEETEKPQEEIAMEVDYEVLHNEYMENPISADAKYKDKMIQLTGKIDDIDREIAGNPYVTFHIGGEYSFESVRITFKKTEEEKVTSLTKGQEITVKGTCKGTLLSTTVSLVDCELIK